MVILVFCTVFIPFSVNSCKQDINTSAVNQLIKSETLNSDVLFGDPYDCSNEDALYCTEPYDCICGSPNSSCCTREDLDPCNYATMGEYADAVACELTKAINGCIPQDWEFGCEYWGTICVKNILTPPSLLSLYPGATPFKYCDASDCSEFYCELPTTLHYQHIFMSISYQNALIYYARQIAQLYKPICEEGKVCRIGRILFKSCLISNHGCNTKGDISCYDKEIRLMIEYYCCPI
ncbi:MAG: hypothetical protein K1X68_02165 [Saprospiraceae bacterium]|nr:hypothetical protein [Saprospiraceae bacterium]HNA65433.1 hypothetical protein [Saprospiraceae bacterium]HNG70230.1 hypothetical protein [Saprospiraceae bacterium]